MKNSRQDIYESDQTGRSDKGAGHDGGQNRWSSSPFSDSKRSAIIFRLVVLAFLAFISLVLIEHLRDARDDSVSRSPSARESSVDIVSRRTDSILDFGDDFEGRLIFDEIMRIEPSSIDDFDDADGLDIFWVKQAAMHLLRGERAYALGEWPEAIEHYTKAKQIIPDIDGVDGKIGLSYMQVQDYEASADAFSRIPKSSEIAFRSINNLGVARLAANRFDEAEQAFATVLEMETEYSPAIHNMGLLYYRTRMFGEAADYFARYLSLEPADIEAMQMYADSLIRVNRWDEAAASLRQSARQLPQAAPIHMSLAYVLSELGQEDEAMESLLRGVDLMDRSRAIVMLAASEYDKLRQRRDFRDLIQRITDE